MFKSIQKNIFQLRGFHTTRKIVVIESDDWGSIRTTSRQAKERLMKKFPHMSRDPYFNFDALEDQNDLNALFEVLTSVKDSKGNHAKLTANTIVANPDFKKIRDVNFQTYFYEPFTSTFINRDGHQNVIDLFKQGNEYGFFKPQLHGREHLNIQQWILALNQQHRELLFAFNYNMFGISLQEKINMRKNVMASLDFTEISDINNHKEQLITAQIIFKEIFGFTSKTFIAPSYIWHKEHEIILKEIGVTTIQGITYQYQPNPNANWYKTACRFTGMHSKSGMMHLVRNAFFEPTINGAQNAVADCLNRIEFAFMLRKPAIIGTHRLNFIGSLDEKNRKDNLILFKTLLQKILKKWPDVEFISSDELANLI